MEKVIERIKKMLRLANDPAASSGERDNAMRMVQATLAKYNLSIGNLGSTDDRGRSDVLAYGRPWARTVGAACAKLYFCKYFYIRTGKDNAYHCFVGTEANRVIAEEMLKYLIWSIFRESRSACTSTADRNSFGAGAASKLWERAVELTEKPPEKAYSGSTALVLVGHYDQEESRNAQWLQEQGVALKVKKTRTRLGSMSGFSKGRVFGEKAFLNKQVH